MLDSQAPNVRITKLRNGILLLFIDWINDTYITKLSVIASRANNIIKKCLFCAKKTIIRIIVVSCIIVMIDNGAFIGLMNMIHFFDLQDQCLY